MIIPQIPLLDRVIKAKGKRYMNCNCTILMQLYNNHWIVMRNVKTEEEAQRIVNQLNQFSEQLND